MATTTYLTGTFFTNSNQDKCTFSVWLKRSLIGAQNNIFGVGSGAHQGSLVFNSSDQLDFYVYASSSFVGRLITNRKFRDTSAWYHIVMVYDSLNVTAGNRMRLYVNGVEETSFATDTQPSSGQDTEFNSGSTHNIGATGAADAGVMFNGCMSHIHFCDGQAYSASDFGETDATTGEWKIKTSPSVTYGTNGFFILKDGNSVTDQSGEGNNFTVGAGTLTNTEDNPSDVFCTLNPLQKPDTSQPNDMSNGNTSIQGNNVAWQRVYGTIGAYKGKWFYEWKCTAVDSYNNRVGWDSIDYINPGADSYYSGLTVDAEGKLRGGILDYSGYDPNSVQMTAAHSGGNLSFTTSDILGMALDRDNNTISIYKNGNLEVDAYSFAGASNCSILLSKGYAVAPSVNFYSASSNINTSQFNFGNGYFGTTAITSEGTNASNIGKFEYDVPTGYTALSTKGFNE